MARCFNTSDDCCLRDFPSLLVERFSDPNRGGSILNLMSATQANAHRFIAPDFCLKCNREAAIGTRAVNQSLVISEQRLDFAFSRALPNHLVRFLRLGCNNGGDTGTNNRSFLGSDFPERRSEIFLMVQGDGSDRDDPRTRNSRRIQSTAQTGLENCQLDAGFFKGKQRDCGDVFKESWQRFQLSLCD